MTRFKAYLLLFHQIFGEFLNINRILSNYICFNTCCDILSNFLIYRLKKCLIRSLFIHQSHWSLWLINFHCKHLIDCLSVQALAFVIFCFTRARLFYLIIGLKWVTIDTLYLIFAIHHFNVWINEGLYFGFVLELSFSIKYNEFERSFGLRSHIFIFKLIYK